MKDKVPNRKQMSLIDLESVNRKLTDSKAILLAKREGIGDIRHAAAGDVTGDGKREVIIGTDVGVVMALSPFGDTLWRFEVPEPITALTTADLDGDGKDEVLVGSKGLLVLNSNGTLNWRAEGDRVRDIAIVHHGNGEKEILAAMDKVRMFAPNGVVSGELEIPSDPDIIEHHRRPYTVEAFDVDSAGEYKIVVVTFSALYLFHRSGDIVWRRTPAECGYERGYWYDVAIALPEDDTRPQIIAGCRGGVTAFGGDGEELWRFSVGNTAEMLPVMVSDMDGDGLPEVVVSSRGRSIYLLDSSGSELWRYETAGWLSCMTLADVDNDGFPGIIAGGGETDHRVYIINAKGELQQEYDVDYRVHSLACDDIDGDGQAEIMVGSADLHVFSHAGKQWQYRSGGRHKVALGDIDGDGAAEIITSAASMTTAYKGSGKALWHCDTGPVRDLTMGRIGDARHEQIVISSVHNQLYLVDAHGETKWQREISWGASTRFAIMDINNDGWNELIVGTSELDMLDASGHKLWGFRASDGRFGFSPFCITTGNVSGYGDHEIIMGGSPGVWVLDAEGEVLWNYLELASEEQRASDPLGRRYAHIRIISIAAADIDNDGKDEVIAASSLSSSGKLYCFDDDGHLLWKREPPRRSEKTTGIRRTQRQLVACADMNGDRHPEIISALGGLSVYNAAGEELWGVATSGEISDIAVHDINGDGHPEVLIASDTLEVFSSDGTRLFSSKLGVGGLENVSVGDVDGDGVPEVVAAGCGVYVLKMSTEIV